MPEKTKSQSQRTGSYNLGYRQVAIDEKREKIIAAARELIMSERALAGFTIEAVARQAGVARMTVYNQFGGKIGLLEALFDDLAKRGQIYRLRDILNLEDPLDALNEFVAAFGRFWTVDRIIIRRLHGMIALDAEMLPAELARQQLRRNGLRGIVGKLRDTYQLSTDLPLDEIIEIAHTLTSFETFDSLAGETRTPEEVVPSVQYLILQLFGLNNSERALS